VADLFYPVLNLLLLLAVLAAFFRKPIREYFTDRRVRIQGELEEAARLRKEAEERYTSWQKRLTELDDELERIRGTARQRAESERDRIVEAAQAAAARIRNDATVAVEHELRRAREQLREDAADLAVELAGDLLREQLDDADRKRLLDEFIDTIQGSAPGNGQGGPPQGKGAKRPRSEAEASEGGPPQGSGS
jgi:F-type H+-transporting ATPase subunit b